VQGWLATPLGVKNPCRGEETCMVELLSQPPTAKRRGTLVHVAIPSGEEAGQLAMNGERWTARATDNSPVNASTTVTVIGPRVSFGNGQCSFRALELHVAPAP